MLRHAGKRLSARLTIVAAVCATAICAVAVTAHAQAPQLITAVRVTGNEYISQDVILADVADILKIGEPYTAQKAQAARQAILREGYFDDVILSTRVAPGGVEVIITVVEKKRIEKIIFVGNTVATDEQLRDAIISKVGYVIDPRVIRSDVSRIQDAYRKLGYIARVGDPITDQVGVLTFVITELRVERIDITGLEKTKEWVVRRQIRATPGAIYREQDVARDHQRIMALDIFESVTPDLKVGQEDPLSGLIIEYKIKEKPTGMASFALAYSTLDRLVIMLSLQDTNLRGRAERGQVNLELVGRTSYDVRFFEPFLDSKGTTLDVALFNTERTRRFVSGVNLAVADDRFDERRAGASLRISRPVTDYSRWSLGLRSERVSSSFIEGTMVLGPGENAATLSSARSRQLRGDVGGVIGDDNPGLKPDLLEPGGGYGPVIISAPLHPGGRVTAATLGWTVDSRLLNATRQTVGGSYWSGNWETAGSILGGDQSFNQISAEWRHFKPVGSRPDVLAVRLLAGASFGDLPLFESFAVGGVNTLRGYSDDRFRGKNMLLANLEYRRMVTDTLGVVAFVDYGDAFGGQFKTIVPGFKIHAEHDSFKGSVGAGLGLRAEVGPLGMFRLDFGWGSEGSQVHFGIGQMF